jgi:methylmalonyl-CoA mutase
MSSYQGGHVEFFKYVVDLLRDNGAQHIQGFGGGGGVIIAREIQALQD